MNTLQLNNMMISKENELWNTIHEIRWSTKASIFNKEANDMVAEYCINYLTIDEIVILHNFVVEKRKTLSAFLMGYLKALPNEEKRKYAFSDDGFWDMCSHIVGMGEAVYNLVMKYPHMMVDLQHEAQENFEYGFDKAVFELSLEKELV